MDPARDLSSLEMTADVDLLRIDGDATLEPDSLRVSLRGRREKRDKKYKKQDGETLKMSFAGDQSGLLGWLSAGHFKIRSRPPPPKATARYSAALVPTRLRQRLKPFSHRSSRPSPRAICRSAKVPQRARLRVGVWRPDVGHINPGGGTTSK